MRLMISERSMKTELVRISPCALNALNTPYMHLYSNVHSYLYSQHTKKLVRLHPNFLHDFDLQSLLFLQSLAYLNQYIYYLLATSKFITSTFAPPSIPTYRFIRYISAPAFAHLCLYPSLSSYPSFLPLQCSGGAARSEKAKADTQVRKRFRPRVQHAGQFRQGRRREPATTFCLAISLPSPPAARPPRSVPRAHR